MEGYGDTYFALIAAQGRIPEMKNIRLTEEQVEQAVFRCEPLEFAGDGTVICVHSDDFMRLDLMLEGKKKTE